MRLKEHLYEYVIRKNKNVQYEYERFVQEHIEEHYQNRWKHWKLLLKLLWHYRVQKSSEPLLYFEETSKPKVVKKTAPKTSAKKKPAKSKSAKSPETTFVVGPESERFKRTYAHHIVRRYTEFDAISFNLFDTLLLRPFANPSDLFFLLEDQFHLKDFHQIRIEAERAAREKALLLRGNSEVTIFDIWEEIEKKTGIPAGEGVKTEFDLEKKLCFANPYFKRVWQILRSYEKTIYIVADTYYPGEMLKELLTINGYAGTTDVLSSCEYNCTKTSANSLFRILLQKTEEMSLIHVGDHYKTDITTAKNFGIETHFYKGVNAVGKQYRADNMSVLIGSAYAGLVNIRLHCGLKRYDIYYEYGFVYGGIYVLGFVNFIYSYCQKENAEKVLFLAKDGDIYRKAFDRLYKTISSEYVYWSKEEASIVFAKENRNFFVTELISRNMENDSEITLSSLFSSAGLEDLLVYFHEYRLHADEYLGKNNRLIVEQLIQEHYEEIAAIYNRSEQQIKSYFRCIIGNAKKVVLVDTGLTGDAAEALSIKLTKDWKLCDEAKCILAGNDAWNAGAAAFHKTDCLVQSYLFSHAHNCSELAGFLDGGRLGRTLFEILTWAPMSALKRIDENGVFRFDVPKVENYQIIDQIQNGILDFITDYTDSFGDFPIMMDISGHDAYMPFQKLFEDFTNFDRGWKSDHLSCIKLLPDISLSRS